MDDDNAANGFFRGMGKILIFILFALGGYYGTDVTSSDNDDFYGNYAAAPSGSIGYYEFDDGGSLTIYETRLQLSDGTSIPFSDVTSVQSLGSSITIKYRTSYEQGYFTISAIRSSSEQRRLHELLKELQEEN